MKVLFVGYSEPHSKKWINVLCDRGHEVYFVIPRTLEKELDGIKRKVEIIQMPFRGTAGYYLNAPALRKIVKTIKPDVVNVHYASGNGTLARLAHVDRLFLSVWGSDVYSFPYSNPLCMRIIKKNLQNADVIGSTSYCMKKQVEKLIGKKKEIVVTPFGVDTEYFSPERFPKKESEEIVIGIVKTLEPQYGIDDLVRSVKVLLSKTDDREIASKIRCKIYGDGYQRKEIEKLISEMELKGVIELNGRIPNEDVPKVLSNIDIFCATSVSESFGVAAVEAQAMCVPVVATDAEGYKEVVEDGVTGIIVKKKDPNSIAEGLKKLVLDEKLRISMGNSGRKRVLNKYDLKRINVVQMENGYKRAIEIASHRGR